MTAEYGFYGRLKAGFPSQVIVDATEVCNLACAHCPHPEFKLSPHYQARYLDVALHNKMVDEVRGLEEAVRPGVDLVLLDLMLPRRAGLEVLTELRKTRPSLPVIILTARGSEDDRVRGLKMGADDYIVKPF